MPRRRLLVIGSQCKALNHLDFMPDVATRLHALLISPGPGECVGVPLEGRPAGLLIDPTVRQAKDAIETAIHEAAEAGEILILAYVGHGEWNGDFYLMPTDASGPTRPEAIHFAEFLNGCIEVRRDHAGLVVLLDACHAGAGAWQSMESWAQSVGGAFGFDLLTATDNRKWGNAPLFRGVIELLDRGDPDVPERIHCRDVHRLLKARNLPTQHVTYNANSVPFHLARNSARDPGDVFWKDSPWRASILKQTEYLQPTPQLAALVEASRSHPVVVVTGAAGEGKSTLASAMARPELTGGLVPIGFAHAVAMLTETTDLGGLVADLVGQLRRSVPGFDEAADEFARSVPLPERDKLEFFPKLILKPLEYLHDGSEIRIVLDAFNQLRNSTRELVSAALADRPACLRLIVTTRIDTPDCPTGHPFDVGRADTSALNLYLTARRLADAARVAILARAGDHWLLARLLADAVLADPAIDLATLPSTVNDAYATLLGQAGAAEAWTRRFRPVLGPLAVSGSGPVLPLPLLVHASVGLGEVADESSVRDVLAALRGLVVRREANTLDEHVGLFHPTLGEYLLADPASSLIYTLDAPAIHRALSQAIDDLAPMSQHKCDDALHRYAFLREAEHLWTLGDVDRTLVCMGLRLSNIPRENLERWLQWLPMFRERFQDESHRYLLLSRSQIAFFINQTGNSRRALDLSVELVPELERVLGHDHPDTLSTRNNVSDFTGRVGNASEALRLSIALLPDQLRVLGPDDLGTLRTRNNIAGWTGESGDARGALSRFTELLLDQLRVLGPDDPGTLMTRNNIAHWTGQVGDARGALQLFLELLPDRVRVLGPDHPDTLSTRMNLAGYTGDSGDASGAIRLLSELLPELERVLGRDHPMTLNARNNIAGLTGRSGDLHRALELSVALLPDRQRVLGPDHPETLTARNNIALWTGESGDPRGALRLYSELLPDQVRVLGPGHPDTLMTRHNIASWTGRVGDARGALRLYTELLPDQIRVLGTNNPRALMTRNNIAIWTGRVGNAFEAVRLFSELLPDQERVVGRDHPDTLNTRNNLAAWSGNSGDARGALLCFVDLLPDQERVVGRDHPDTLRTRNNIANWTGRTGNAHGALLLFSDLLPDQTRVLGRNHPETLKTRDSIAGWTGESGDAACAMHLLTDLLPDRERVLGPEHPDTLTTRSNLASWIGEIGDARGALRLNSELLPVQERVLGLDHPDTLATLGSIGVWAIRSGDREGGCRRLHETFARALARFGPDHLITRQFLGAIHQHGCA